MYQCPVCGYAMVNPPQDYNICSCCGTEFGLHDINSSIEALRECWVEGGCKFWSKYNPPPENWNPSEQLARLKDAILVKEA